MQSVPVATFRPGEIQPRFPDKAELLAIMLAPNLTLSAGQILAQLTGAATNDVQTLAGSGSGGTFSLTYGGQTTSALPYNAAAAQIQAALQALSSIGTGNVICTGGPLATGNVVCTFQGLLAAMPITPMVVNVVTGSPSVTNTHTTTGVAGWRYTSYNSAKVANPTTAPTLSDSSTAGTWSTAASSTWEVCYTYVTPAGESLPSYAATIALGTASHSIGIASITGIPNGVTAVNVYVNGFFAFQQAVTSNATGAFVVSGPAAANAATPPPSVSTAYLNNDGSATGRLVLKYGGSTDNFGNFYPSTTTSTENLSAPDQTAPAYYLGDFRIGDLTGVDANLLTQGACRLVEGLSISDTEGILRFF